MPKTNYEIALEELRQVRDDINKQAMDDPCAFAESYPVLDWMIANWDLVSVPEEEKFTRWDHWFFNMSDEDKAKVQAWLLSNPPPANWQGSERAWAYCEMEFAPNGD